MRLVDSPRSIFAEDELTALPSPSESVRIVSWTEVTRRRLVSRGQNRAVDSGAHNAGIKSSSSDIHIVMGASMIAVRGRIQREGEVVHLVAHRLVDLSAELATVGAGDAPFPLPHGRGDQVTHAGGGPDPRELPPKGLRTRDIYVPEHIDIIKSKSRNFH